MAFDQAAQEKACELIADGATLTEAANAVGVKSPSTITDLARKDAPFAAMYARALDDRAETLVDQLLPIADDPNIETNDKRIRVDTRKWIASKLMPRKYGDRVQSDVDLNVKVTLVNPFQLAQDAAQAALAPQPAIEQDK